MKEPIAYWIAADVLPIAEDLIAKHHGHLLDAKILYLFTNQQRKKCDRVRLGSAQKLGALHRFLASGMTSVDAGHDFLILLDANEWGELTTAQQIALVDHELSHAGRGERELRDGTIEGFWTLLGHDLEEFHGVIARHGLWREDARKMAQVMRQLPLFEETSQGTITVRTGERTTTGPVATAETALRIIKESHG